MIYKCENCKNRENCVENKAQYTALCKVVEAVLKLDNQEEFRSWFSFSMRCDYFSPDRSEELHTCDGRRRNPHEPRCHPLRRLHKGLPKVMLPGAVDSGIEAHRLPAAYIMGELQGDKDVSEVTE